MPERTMKIGEIAKQLSVDPNTVRGWCRRHARYLSEGANPPPYRDRIFTVRDLNVLTYISVAVNDGMNHHELGEQLAARTFREDDVDVVVGMTEIVPAQAKEGEAGYESPESSDSPSQAAVQPSGEAFGVQIVLTDHTAQLGELRRTVSELQRDLIEVKAKQENNVNANVTWAIVGAFVAFAILALAWGGVP